MHVRLFLFRVLFLIGFLSLTGCSGFDIINGLTPSSGYNQTLNIAYGKLPRQRLDVYQPKSVYKPAGIVVFFYGGYWQYGSKSEYQFVAEALTSKGYVAVLPDYRVYPQTAFPGFVQDGAAAVRWVHDHTRALGSDPQHIYLMGHSAGAHIAALLTLDGRYLQAEGLDRSAIRATVGLAGPYDFKIDGNLRAVFGATSATQPVTPDAEPINFVDGHEAPMLLINGSADTTVEPGNALRLAGKIREKGGEVEVKLYPHRSHTSVVEAFARPLRWLNPPALADSIDFLRRH